MTAASAAQQWEAVRASALAIGMELSSTSGVVEENWGWVIVRCVDDGEAAEYYARRTGPVTARILENAPAHRRQHVGDWVVFDAELLYPPPEDEAERERFVPTYAQVHVLQAGGYGSSWLVDGVHPGEPAIEALREEIEARGWKLWVHSRDDYHVIDPQHPDAFDPEDAARACPACCSPWRCRKRRRRWNCIGPCWPPPRSGRTRCAGCVWPRPAIRILAHIWKQWSVTGCKGGDQRHRAAA